MLAKKTPAEKVPEKKTAVRLVATPNMYRQSMQGTALVPITSAERLRDAFLQEIVSGQYCTEHGYSPCQCDVLKRAAEAMQSKDSRDWARFISFYVENVAKAMKIGYSEAQAILMTDFAVCMAWIAKVVFGQERWLRDTFAGKTPA